MYSFQINYCQLSEDFCCTLRIIALKSNVQKLPEGSEFICVHLQIFFFTFIAFFSLKCQIIFFLDYKMNPAHFPYIKCMTCATGRQNVLSFKHFHPKRQLTIPQILGTANMIPCTLSFKPKT